MKQPTTRSRHKVGKSPTENQQNLDRYYWELNHCLRQDPDHKHRILLRAIKQTDALRKKIKQLYK
ncbi:MAG: hypothetical protein ACFB15_28245 [Cyclobacteriaceae bacterium]